MGAASALRQNAYILFYVRDAPNELPPVITPTKPAAATQSVKGTHDPPAGKQNGRGHSPSVQSAASSDGYFSARSLSLRTLVAGDSSDESESEEEGSEEEDSESEEEESDIDVEESDNATHVDRSVGNGSISDGSLGSKSMSEEAVRIETLYEQRMMDGKQQDIQSTSAVTESTRTLESESSSPQEASKGSHGEKIIPCPRPRL